LVDPRWLEIVLGVVARATALIVDDGWLPDDGRDPQAAACSALPIIAMTAKDDYGERDRCIAAGGSDYIPKPIDPGRLMILISHWLPAFVVAA
jgi:DNA-binding response OmpR family regulator